MKTEGVQWKRAVAWAFYDWANSAFAVTAIAGLVPIFNKEFWSSGLPETESTFHLGLANSLAGLLMAAIAPALGAIADQGGAKKRFLLMFASMGVVMTGSLFFVERGHWMLAMALYGLAFLGFTGGNLFYDSLLVTVAEERKLDVVSSLGYALGYIGGGLLFAFNVAMVLKPQLFGLADATEAVRWSFVAVAIWWAVFTLPILLVVPEPARTSPSPGILTIVAAGFRQLGATFREIRRLRVLLFFLLGYWLYIDGVDTVIAMAVDYGKALKFPTQSLITALLITQFVGFPAALAFGTLGEKLGTKVGILIGLAVYVIVCIFGYRMQQVSEFYVLAVVVGLVQGGVQALSRSFYARLIPKEKAAEFFGFYNMVGKFATVLGPAIMGSVAYATGNPRLGILGLIPLFLVGGLLLAYTPPRRAEGA